MSKNNRKKLIAILSGYKTQLQERTYNVQEHITTQKPNTRSLRKDERAMKARDNLIKPIPKEEK